MRFLIKVSISVEAGNDAARKGFDMIPAILEEQKPEAAYFVVTGGQRTALIFVNMDDPSELPKIAEPYFLAFNANIEVTPAMVAEDLQKAGPSIEATVQKYG